MWKELSCRNWRRDVRFGSKPDISLTIKKPDRTKSESGYFLISARSFHPALSHSLLQIKPIQFRHLRPYRDKIVDELVLRIGACIHLCLRTQDAV